MKKKGYFFTIDAFMAIAIIIVGFILISQTYVSRQEETQTSLIPEDILSILSNTEVFEINDPEIYNMFCEDCPSRIIDNKHNTLAEQAAIFYQEGRNDNTTSLLERSLKSGLVSPQHNYAVYIDGWEAFQPADQPSQNFSELLLSSKKIILAAKVSGELAGPYVLEVRAWQ